LVGGTTATRQPGYRLVKILAFAAFVEVGTGLVLILDPAMVSMLLLGADVSGAGRLLGRFFGIALLALGLACWPERKQAVSSGAAIRAMLVYNLLVALYLGYLRIAEGWGGLLWGPGVVIHASVALILGWQWARKLHAQGNRT
jgi:hypothetical protein